MMYLACIWLGWILGHTFSWSIAWFVMGESAASFGKLVELWFVPLSPWTWLQNGKQLLDARRDMLDRRALRARMIVGPSVAGETKCPCPDCSPDLYDWNEGVPQPKVASETVN